MKRTYRTPQSQFLQTGTVRYVEFVQINAIKIRDDHYGPLGGKERRCELCSPLRHSTTMPLSLFPVHRRGSSRSGWVLGGYEFLTFLTAPYRSCHPKKKLSTTRFSGTTVHHDAFVAMERRCGGGTGEGILLSDIHSM